MEQTIPEQNSDKTLVNTSTSPTPLQDGSAVPLRDDRHSLAPESVKVDRDEQSFRGGTTGPRTELGKQRASRNSIKHGIFSRATLLKGEARSEFQALLAGLWNALEPVGGIETVLVDKLATILWRYRRMLVAEKAEIRKSSEFLEFDRQWKEEEQAEEISRRREATSLVDLIPNPVGLIWQIHNPDVLERCLELLVELRQEIKSDGLDEGHNGSLLLTIYGDSERPHLRQTLHDEYSACLSTVKATEEEGLSEGYATRELCKKSVLRGIDVEIDRLTEFQEKCKSIEFERTKVEILRQRVPDSLGMDRLLRYESSLERAFDRALTQLERLQRMRKGQPVLPAVKVDISS